MRWMLWPGLLLTFPGCARAQQWQAPTPRATIGCRALCDMTAEDRYHGEDGGLYGGGRNSPPEAHLRAALAVAQQVRAAAQGSRLAVLAVGMSNTTQEFSTFLPLARDDATRGSWVVPVDGAQGGADANTWNQSLQPWENLHWRVINAGCRPEQVQVVWLKQALGGPARHGAFPAHADVLREALKQNLWKLRERYPNLRLCYLSSRIYAGWAKTALNPEPYAYESGYAVRRLILDQVGGAADLNWDPAKGAIRAPLLLWGPYLWTDGTTARADGLVWNQADCRADDGTHPSDSGRRKVAELLLKFCQTDATAKVWYLH